MTETSRADWLGSESLTSEGPRDGSEGSAALLTEGLKSESLGFADLGLEGVACEGPRAVAQQPWT